MKRQTIATAGCVVALAMFMADLGRANPSDGLVAQYLFSGNANDTSGNGYDGVVCGPVLTTDRNGTLDSAYSFDGIDDYISVLYASGFNLQTFTITGWVCPSSDLSLGNGSAVVAARGEGFTNDRLSMSLEIVSEGNAWGAGATLLYENSGDTEQVFDTGLFPEVGTWSLVAATRSSDGAVSVYIDGTLAGNWSGTPNPATCTQDLTIGARWWSPSTSGPYSLAGFFSGSLDDICLYDRALTADEMNAMCSHSLIISSGDGGSVTVPGQGTFSYDDGASVPVVATAEAHHHFVNWTGTAVDAGQVSNAFSANTNVTMHQDCTLRANFAIDQHSLMVAADGDGTADGSGTYDWDSSVPVKATPNANHHFANWTTNGSLVVADTTSANTTVIVNGDGTMTAHFAIDQHTLTTSSTDGGTASSPGTGSFQYDHGAVVPVVATPEAHHHFVNWTGTAVTAGKVDDPTSASTNVTMDADYSLQAEFVIDTHTLTLNCADGCVTCDPSKPSYPYGETVILQVTANSGYRFVDWSGDLSGSNNPVTMMMDGDKVITANFIILRNLAISSTAGGVVTSPGEGTLVYDDGTRVSLEARPDALFEFVGWRGSLFADSTPYSLIMDAEYTIKACFESILSVLYVDDDAPSDPGPGDPNISDPLEDGTPEQPFDSIQKAIEVARAGARILVRGGVYREQLDFMGKNIRVEGLWLSDPNVAQEPIVDGNGVGPVVCFSGGEDANCVLAGLRIQGGHAPYAAAILCEGSPTIANCLIAGNRATDLQGAVIHCGDSSATFINCTITENAADPHGALMVCVDSHVTLTNSILWGNTPSTIRTVSGAAPTIAYCDVDVDPAFVEAGSWTEAGIIGWPCDDLWTTGDYHLQSEAGHWDAAGAYIKDAASSPCIDAGDPAGDFAAEPAPNGGRVNMGAYGGTRQASLSHE